jgi:hypothetical protein
MDLCAVLTCDVQSLLFLIGRGCTARLFSHLMFSDDHLRWPKTFEFDYSSVPRMLVITLS